MSPNGNRPGEGAAHSVGMLSKASENTRQADIPQGANPAATRPSPLAVFTARCEARALLWKTLEIDLHEAVDELQAAAVASGLVAQLGEDQAQAIIAKAFEAVR